MKTTLVTLALVLAVAASATRAASADPFLSGFVACDVPMRSWPELTALLSSTGVATPAATTEGQTLPVGTPASRQEAEAMAALVQRWLACQNGGEQLRAWSLFTDGYLYRLLIRQEGLTEAAFASLATPTPSTSDPAELLTIEGERVLPDGRLGATVILGYPSIPMPKRFFFYFTRSDGHLLIDGILGEISFSVP